MCFNRSNGMTLIELLVVMVLLSIVSALLFQGLSVGLSTYERVKKRQSEGEPVMLASRWFIDSLSGIQAELDSSNQFYGSADTISGMTHSPLLGRDGMVQRISWQLKSDGDGHMALYYNQAGNSLRIIGWPTGISARFLYRSNNGSTQEKWPLSDNNSLLLSDGAIPSAIVLEVVQPAGMVSRWYVSIIGRTYPRIDYRDI